MAIAAAREAQEAADAQLADRNAQIAELEAQALRDEAAREILAPRPPAPEAPAPTLLAAEPVAPPVPEAPIASEAPEPEPVASEPTQEPPSADSPLGKEAATRKVAEIAERTRGGESPVEDDLKRVHGIGPVIDGLLKGMGITSFRQIARLQHDDIAYVAAALESFPDRIQRDDWMTSAARLHEEKYGTTP